MSTMNEAALLGKIVFSGKEEDYEMWYRKFTSFMKLRGYKKELNGIVRLSAEMVDDGDDLRPERDYMESMERSRGGGSKNGGTRHYTIACWKCDGNHDRKADCPHRHHHEESDYDRDDAAMLMFVGTLECEHEYLLINTAEKERENFSFG